MFVSLTITLTPCDPQPVAPPPAIRTARPGTDLPDDPPLIHFLQQLKHLTPSDTGNKNVFALKCRRGDDHRLLCSLTDGLPRLLLAAKLIPLTAERCGRGETPTGVSADMASKRWQYSGVEARPAGDQRREGLASERHRQQAASTQSQRGN